MKRDEAGIVLIAWIMGLAFILLPVVGLAGAAVHWVPRVNAAQSSAYEAARTAVATLDEEAGRQRGLEVWANHGFDADSATVSFTGDLRARGGDVTATITVELPVIWLPGAGSAGGVSWSTDHTERVSDYRSIP